MRFDWRPWRFHIVLSFFSYPMIALECRWYLPHVRNNQGYFHFQLACVLGIDMSIFYSNPTKEAIRGLTHLVTTTEEETTN